jgi:hypothetical protein
MTWKVTMSHEEIEANKLREKAAEVIAEDLGIADWRMILPPRWAVPTKNQRLWIDMFRAGVHA